MLDALYCVRADSAYSSSITTRCFSTTLPNVNLVTSTQTLFRDTSRSTPDLHRGLCFSFRPYQREHYSMGIRGLWKILKPAAEVRALTELSITEGFQRRREMVLGVDVSVWISQCQFAARHAHAQSGENPELRTLFYRLARYLKSCVTLVFVFDGPGRPSTKRSTNVITQDHWLTEPLKELIAAFGFHSHVAPGEAEAELASMCRAGAIFAVLTNDSDVFLFGGSRVIYNPLAKDDGENVTIYTQVPLTRGGLILIGLLRGGDYDQTGLPGCGMTIAHRLALSGLGDSLFTAAQSLSPVELTSFLCAWRSDLCHELLMDASGFLGRKYPTLANAVPESFPNPVVLSLYVTPLTSWSVGGAEPSLPCLQRQQLNIGRLVAFCRRRFSWGTNPGIQTKFFNIVWDPVCIQILHEGRSHKDKSPFSAPSSLAIRRVRNKSGLKYYRVEYEVRALSAIVNSCFNPGVAGTQPDGQPPYWTRKVWIPAPIVDFAAPEMVAAYEARHRSGVTLAGHRPTVENNPAPCSHGVFDLSHDNGHSVFDLSHDSGRNIIDLTGDDEPDIITSDATTEEVIDLTEGS